MEQLDVDMLGVIGMRQDLESQRNGVAVEQVQSQWYDPENVLDEVNELRRVRRQIRYMFGGQPSFTEANSPVRVKDLLEAQADVREVPPLATIPARPRSGNTDLSARTDSSGYGPMSGSGEDQQGRHEKPHRHHRHRRHRRPDGDQEVAAGQTEIVKRSDGTRQVPDWAQEVVRASIDPGNRWEFPSQAKGLPQQAPLPWEQPRGGPGAMDLLPNSARGEYVVERARQRADEVLRSERHLQR